MRMSDWSSDVCASDLWVGAGLFQWILGGEDEKRLGQGMRDASIADRVLLHRLEQCSLGFGRGAVELIGEQQMGEYRAALKLEVTTTGAVIFFQDFGADDIAGQIGRAHV